MLDRTGSRGAHARLCALPLAIAGLLATSASTVFADAPAFANEAGFDHAFAAYELADTEADPSAATLIEAETRFAQAPVDEAEQAEVIGTGNASYYGSGFAGRPTASGERFNPAALTAAHRTLPFGTKVKVTNTSNGRSVVVRINDRGPFHGNRMIDLSAAAAREIGLISQGQGRVQLAHLGS